MLRPDGKAQVTVGYQDGRAVSIDNVLVSAQHHEDFALDDLTEFIESRVIKPVLEDSGFSFDDCKYLVNPTGRFVVGGPKGDAGLTGRKIIVDTYGGSARHGGGAFSGKDPSKVDRSGAYALRWVAKHIVEAGLADRAELQIAYAIGVAEPVSYYLETFGTAKMPETEILDAVKRVFDLKPQAIIEALDLRRPIFAKTASYGHFGRQDPDFTWESTSRLKELLQAIR
jgi:S-adenosylmethionine synthetase